MRKSAILAALLSLLCLCPMVGRADDYRPMVREGVKWVYFFIYKDNEGARPKTYYAHINYEFSGEVEICGNTYMTCWRTIVDPQGHFDATPEPVAYVREEDRKVYALYDDRFVAQVRDYHAGFRDYCYREDIEDPLLSFDGGEKSVTYAFTGDVSMLYPPKADEYLIYDFNDLPAFYDRHPRLVYETVVDGYAPTRYTRSYGWRTTAAGTYLIQGRDVPYYLVRYGMQTEMEPVSNGAPGAARGQVRAARRVLEGYGIVEQFANAGESPNLVLTVLCQSFLSPAASFRNPYLLYDRFDQERCPVTTFGFCHIEDGGEIVYRIRDCYFIEDHHAEQMAEGGDPEDGVGVDDVPVRQAVVDGVTYDLQGRSVADTDAPGIYIRDGRKVAVTR